jgi:4-aminobutyrate aminotransferase-like enzyme
MITAAKGLANGMPIGLTVARSEVADALKGLTISTFGGNPVATTAAKAVLDFIRERSLPDNVSVVGDYLRQRLLELQEKHTIIGEVRGMGLLLAMELVEDRKTKEPATAKMARLLEETREERILIGKGGLFGNVARLSPPMNIAKADVDEFVKRLDASLQRVTG